MADQEQINALEVAITNEMQERKFYLRHAQMAKNPLGRAMFEQIADDELEHYRRLKQLEASWKTDEGFPETVPAKIKDSDLRKTMRDLLEETDALPETDDDELEALRTAMDFEARGVAFYTKLRDSVTDLKEKAFFDLLAHMEQEHYFALKKTKDYLTDPSAWFKQA
jgi:rubrerythrin